MKFCACICCYNDIYIEEVIASLIKEVDELFILEGAWQGALNAGFPARSNQETLDKIYKFSKEKNVHICHINLNGEKETRQYGLERCRAAGADWLLLADGDEVFPQKTLQYIKDTAENCNDALGFRVHSYNFINSYKKYYNGLYPRVYRMTPGAYVPYANYVYWNDLNIGNNGYKELSPDYRFFHYNYVKPDPEAFEIRKIWLKHENGCDLTKEGYEFSGIKYKIPVLENEIFDFKGKHPSIMKNNKYFIENIFKDVKIEFES